ncbi:MAG: hypothetical protein AB4062_06735 [Crocosphaera sp.]
MTTNNVCIIGPRSSGKTTYLAALLYHEEHRVRQNKKSSYRVTAQTVEARELKEKAETLLKRGLGLEATKLGDEIQNVYDLPFYSFTIEREISGFGKLFKKEKIAERFQITTRDYPGEVFDALVDSNLLGDYREAFVKDCFDDKRGCVMMLPAWESGSDLYYLSLLQNFFDLMESEGKINDYKMAVVMSKCERGEIWPGRHQPELDLFQLHLKKTTRYLRQKIAQENLAFFALSTFGIRGDKDPRPNRIDLVTQGKEPGSVLLQYGEGINDRGKSTDELWKPYNLIEPLYWLMTS